MKSILPCSIILALLLTGCPSDPNPTNLKVSAIPTSVEPGQTSKLKASINGTPSSVNWNLEGTGTLSAQSGTNVTYTATGAAIGDQVVIKASKGQTSTPITLSIVGPLDWSKTLASNAGDSALSIAIDSDGSVLVAGMTEGALFGKHQGQSDVFIVKYDASANELWKQQLGSNTFDGATAVASDAENNVLLAGFTSAVLAGSHAGNSDAFLIKYDPAGQEVWKRQLGSSAAESSIVMTTDSSGNVLLAGYTLGSIAGNNQGSDDAFVIKFDKTGNELWRKQFGSAASDQVTGIATDSQGNVVLCGFTLGDLGSTNLGGYDAFLVKFNPQGQELWKRQLGSDKFDRSSGVSSDGNSFYLSGYTEGDLAGSLGKEDAFLIKLDSSGVVLWKKQFGSVESEQTTGVVSDTQGNVYISGWTYGPIGANPAGQLDAFLVSYGPQGNPRWQKQWGSAVNDQTNATAVDTRGHVFVAGSTGVALEGSGDAFVQRFPQTP